MLGIFGSSTRLYHREKLYLKKKFHNRANNLNNYTIIRLFVTVSVQSNLNNCKVKVQNPLHLMTVVERFKKQCKTKKKKTFAERPLLKTTVSICMYVALITITGLHGTAHFICHVNIINYSLQYTSTIEGKFIGKKISCICKHYLRWSMELQMTQSPLFFSHKSFRQTIESNWLVRIPLASQDAFEYPILT